MNMIRIFSLFVLAIFVTSSDSLSLQPVYSTYLGGTASDQIVASASSADGRLFVVGYTLSPSFPIVGGFRAATSSRDVFLAIFDSNGVLNYSTTYGGSSVETPYSMAVSSNGNLVYITGTTTSIDLPLVGSSARNRSSTTDCFVAIINIASANFSFSSYFGGISNIEFCRDIALNSASGEFVVSGSSQSVDLPLATNNKTSGVNDDAFVAFFSATGDLISTTYFGGSGFDTVSDAEFGNNQLVVYGYTFNSTTQFPTVNGAYQQSSAGTYDAFLMILSLNPTTIVYSTLFGGAATETGTSMLVNANGIYVTGSTASSNFPIIGSTASVLGTSSSYLILFDFTATPVYSTVVPYSSGNSIKIDATNTIFIVGITQPGFNQVGSTANCSSTGSAFITAINFDSVLYSSCFGGTGTASFTGSYLSGSTLTAVGYTNAVDFTTLNANQATSAGGYEGIISSFTVTGLTTGVPTTSVPTTAAPSATTAAPVTTGAVVTTGTVTTALPVAPCGVPCLTTPSVTLGFINNSPNFKLFSGSPGAVYTGLQWNALVETTSQGIEVKRITIPTSGYSVSTSTYMVGGSAVQNANFTVVLSNQATIRFVNELFESPAIVQYAGIQVPIDGKSNKLSLEIISWNFDSPSNTLSVESDVTSNPAIISTTASEPANHVLRYTVDNGLTSMPITLVDLALNDGVPTAVKTSLDTDRLLIVFASFTNRLYYDPSFSVLVDGENKEQQQSSQASSKPSMLLYYYVGAFGGAFVLMVIIAIVLVITIRRHRNKKAKLQGLSSYQDVSQRFSRAHLTTTKESATSDTEGEYSNDSSLSRGKSSESV